MDPLSELLSLLKPRTYTSGGFDLGGAWAIQFGHHEGIKCYALARGRCWLVVEGVTDPIQVEAGDCFLLPRGLPFRLASDLAVTPMDAHKLFVRPLNGQVATWNGGGDCFGVGAHFTLSGPHARTLLNELPPIVHLRSDADKAELRYSMDRMSEELREQRPGSALVAQQLATMMLVQALRLHLQDGLAHQAGWLAALTDPQISAAVTAMHSAPAHAWTLQALAEHCGMSRSIFALRFRSIVGVPAMEYLTRWRMWLAAEQLTTTNESVSAIARSLGYESESAFGKAFRRVMSCSPRQYRRGGPEANLTAPVAMAV